MTRNDNWKLHPRRWDIFVDGCINIVMQRFSERRDVLIIHVL